MKSFTLVIAALAILFRAGPVYAHKPSEAYLFVEETEDAVSGRWDIAVRDLDFALDIDADGDGRIVWSEIAAVEPAITDYAFNALKVRSGTTPCGITPGAALVNRRNDGGYLTLPFTARCDRTGVAEPISISYGLFFELDTQHRGLLRARGPGGAESLFVFTDSVRETTLAPASGTSSGVFGNFLLEGIHHIWIGYDHILFLLALLLPALLPRQGRSSSIGLVPTAWRIAGIVTAFTAAHSLTLSLSATTIISLPSRLVESAIAFSVVIVALRNTRARASSDTTVAAFVFGLVHGCGFASVLSELGLPPGAMWRPLLGFNLGVEVGQLAIVAAFLAVVYPMRQSGFYRAVLVRGGSASIAAVALVWFAERALDVQVF